MGEIVCAKEKKDKEKLTERKEVMAKKGVNEVKGIMEKQTKEIKSKRKSNFQLDSLQPISIQNS